MNAIIVDYGLCNLDSVKRAVEECGGNAIVTDQPDLAKKASKIFLPGVGNFMEGIQRLKRTGWYDVLRKEVVEKKIPLLGICLGMQLLAGYGEEGGGSEGLRLIPGKVVKLHPHEKSDRIPHVGWNEVIQEWNSPLFEGIQDGKDFYFVHSYHFIPEDSGNTIATTPYCGGFVSAVNQGNVYGVQFHPEKSQRVGFALIRNFLSI